MGFLSELRERRMVQIVLSYAGVAWAILEVTDQLVSNEKIPELTYSIVLIWVVLGFPAALLVGWHHGEKGKQKAPLGEVALLIMLAVIGLGLSGSTASQHFVNARAQAAMREGLLSAQRVAVLYFDDRTGEDNRYLADAVTEELIAALSQVRDLDVVSRNGTLPFRDTDVAPDSIARALRAGTLVEGSIEKRGENRLRVNLVIRQSENAVPVEYSNFDVAREDLLELSRAVADRTSMLLRPLVGREVRVREWSAGASNPVVWQLAQRAEKVRKDAEALIARGDVAAAWAVFDSADATLAQAEQVDQRWSLLPAQRSYIAYRRARLAQGSPEQAEKYIRDGVRHADEALRRSPGDARALELRGSLRYYEYLLELNVDPRAQEALLASARADLETAIERDRSSVLAHAMLSHLYFQDLDFTQAVLAATQAYEADAYLENVELVVQRLFNASLNLGNFRVARQWCDEGQRRFPDDFRFTSCRLILMITTGVEASALSVDSAWALYARIDSITPARRKPIELARAGLVVGGVIARVATRDNNPALRDSARAVLARSTADVTESVDPTRELALVEAYMRILTQEKDRAVDLLVSLRTTDPRAFQRNPGEVAWWWTELTTDPRFRRLAGLN